MAPDALIVQDATLTHQVELFSGWLPGGYLLVNSSRSLGELGLSDLVESHGSDRLLTVPATELALEHTGRPVPNAVLLGGFAALTGVVSIDAVVQAIAARFSGKVGTGNIAAARARRFASWKVGEGCSPMLRQVEGSWAVAEAVALCRPEVVCAYPISPQTHIIEGIGALVKSGQLANCEFINVESEFAAMSVCIGASATGARAYTATASQGLLFMIEAVYNASGLGLPIVMTLANRAIGAPINIWNDHSDAMAVRDAGWIQLFAETNQEAVDLHVQAFRLAEELSMPVMVCMDGFILTHAFEAVEIPTQSEVDAFVPPYEPRQVLDPHEPVSIGAMVGPEAFEEVRYLAHVKQLQALDLIPEIAAEFAASFGRRSGGLVSTYRSEDAETIVVALGSVLGTIKDAVDSLREEGMRIGVVGIGSFRPFPTAAVRDALGGARRVVVIEKALAPGAGGIVATDVAMATAGLPPQTHAVIAGLGGRPITKRSLLELFQVAQSGSLETLTFLDLDRGLVDGELARMAHRRRSGPTAENVLRDVGIVSARVT